MACSDKLVSPFGGMPLIKCLIDQAGIRELHAIRDMPQSGSNHTRYDGLARRITRYTNAEDVTMHSYYNDEWRPVEERKDNETTAAASYLWGSRHRDDLVRRDRAVGGTTLNETRYILMDYFSPAAITDEEGDVTERYQFSAFGLRTILNPDFTVRSDSECGMELSFQGQFEDVETGWLNYGYRYYLPALGRWACKDPDRNSIFIQSSSAFTQMHIKLQKYQVADSKNVYVFINNDAQNHIDHLGLFILLKHPYTDHMIFPGGFAKGVLCSCVCFVYGVTDGTPDTFALVAGISNAKAKMMLACLFADKASFSVACSELDIAWQTHG